MKELIKYNEWEYKISKSIKNNQDKEGFPQLADYGLTREEFDDYVVEKQYLLNRMDNHKSSFVVPGVLLVIPVLIVSMFTDSVWGLFGSVAVGVIIASAYMLIMSAVDKKKLLKIYDDRIESYITDIVNY